MIDDLEQLDEKWLKTVLEEAEKIAWPSFMEISGEKTAALIRIALAAKSAKDSYEIALELSREIVSITQQEHLGGICQMQAKIQCLIEDSVMLAKAPGIPNGYNRAGEHIFNVGAGFATCGYSIDALRQQNVVPAIIKPSES